MKLTEMMQSNGCLIDLADIDPDKIDIASAVCALAKEVRFAGHLHAFYTVASHTVAMYSTAKMMGESDGTLRLILLHDMHECFTGDIPSPVKRLIGPEIGKLQDKIDQAIFAKFRFLPTPAEVARVKHYDALIWRAELHVINDEPWDRLDDDMKQLMCRSVEKVSHMTVSQMQRSFMTALNLQFTGQEVMQ